MICVDPMVSFVVVRRVMSGLLLSVVGQDVSTRIIAQTGTATIEPNGLFARTACNSLPESV